MKNVLTLIAAICAIHINASPTSRQERQAEAGCRWDNGNEVFGLGTLHTDDAGTLVCECMQIGDEPYGAWECVDTEQVAAVVAKSEFTDEEGQVDSQTHLDAIVKDVQDGDKSS
ncbi:hypothetical protein SARC_05664 [Sphaeroforma arctica JP610]|uniref:Uncharacterized protein n=1 Tax=Sphaeroforma arctica JP610 TaxID=667725 RepID=A0A0L0FYX9_9EUKA|nr:hypothetical protein SARC_05664 [Sphaeroforma arctica JP610]KNC82047.1 hypothetical protein SARC_05664 [Sphaeroforma arctica JP610]|eukprot:XP_014155949.1 hypothetical protein SARC_05664 [Sphaeroforma arctica JP610]